MANGNLPEIPKTWFDFLKEIAILIAAIGGATSAVISGCNTAKVNQVQQHQQANAEKLDVVKEHQQANAAKLDSIEKNSAAIRGAMPSK